MMQAKQVPLVEQLESVPEDARLIYDHSQFHSESIPVGVLCKEAAKELRSYLAKSPVAWSRKVILEPPPARYMIDGVQLYTWVEMQCYVMECIAASEKG
jgi:hypothetical protein